jgi:hypothetical protein
MKDYQKRVVVEKKELDVKREKLTAFLQTDVYTKLDVQEQRRLSLQSNAMNTYSQVLKERIDNFKD